MSLSTFFSSFFTVVHADAPAEPAAEVEQAEAEAEEPQDLHPVIQDECKASAKCAPLVKHFEHCQEKVTAGQGYKGEDCVEELMMHCVDACAAPKLFSKLK